MRGGTLGGRVLLSCTADGARVDLLTADDNSGRQKWNLEPTGQGNYHIVISGVGGGGGVCSYRKAVP